MSAKLVTRRNKNEVVQNRQITSKSSSMDSDSQESSVNTEEEKFEKEHGVESIPERHPTRDKLVIKVQDTGLGIKRKDRIKLFRLFGKL